MILTNKQTFSDAQLKLIEEKILQGKANEVLHLIPTNRKVRSLKKEIIDRTPAHAVSVLPIETIFTLAEKLFSVDKPLSLASEAASSVLLKKAFQKNKLEYFRSFSKSIPLSVKGVIIATPEPLNIAIEIPPQIEIDYRFPLIKSSAICTALEAAPFLTLSATTHRFNPFSTE